MMGYTKRQIVDAALTEIGLGEYSFDIAPEQKQEALRRLDSMLAEWDGRNIRIFYPIPGNPEDSDIEQKIGVPAYAWEALITNLAIRIAPSYGKTVSPNTMTTARHALNTLMARSATPPEMQLASIPSGAGHKNIDVPFLDPGERSELETPEPTFAFE